MHGRALKDYGDQLDFFDSVGVYIEIRITGLNFTETNVFSIFINGEYFGYDFTRKQATKEAIKHATLIYNEKFK